MLVVPSPTRKPKYFVDVAENELSNCKPLYPSHTPSEKDRVRAHPKSGGNTYASEDKNLSGQLKKAGVDRPAEEVEPPATYELQGTGKSPPQPRKHASLDVVRLAVEGYEVSAIVIPCFKAVIIMPFRHKHRETPNDEIQFVEYKNACSLRRGIIMAFIP